MIALEVFVNDRKIALAGAEDLVVLHAIINAVGKLGTKARGTKHSPRGRDLFLSVSGLTGRTGGAADEHLRWTREVHEELAIGDEVRVRIVRAKRADRPKSRHRAAAREDAGREQFERAKRIYLAERDKYEPTAASTRRKR
jgi:DNA-directed RNA polymerase subunit E'/Rpb7